MTLRVVGIHGVGNHRRHLTDTDAAHEISQLWTAVLRPCLPDRVTVDLEIAYYANHLHTDLAQGVDDGLDWLTADEYGSLRAWANELGALPSDVAQARWSIPARMIVDRITELRHLNTILVRPFVATFLREVSRYFRPDAPTRQLVQQVIVEQIRAHRPNIVIAHSLGSVIAYETLWAHPDLHADLLITLGSPLGMKAVIFDRLEPRPHNGFGLRPPNVGRWVNIADPGDIVAIPRPFTRRFIPDANYDRRHIHWGNFHSVCYYLTSHPTLSAINAYLNHRPPLA